MTRICVLDGFSNDLVEDPVAYADEIVMRFSPASGKLGRLLERGAGGRVIAETMTSMLSGQRHAPRGHLVAMRRIFEKFKAVAAPEPRAKCPWAVCA